MISNTPQKIYSIKNGWIYENILLADDDIVFKLLGYYIDSTQPYYVSFYFKDLPVQTPLRDLRGIFRKTITKINKVFHKIHYTATKNIFNIITKDLVSVDILENSFKTIYIVSMERKEIPKNWEQKWYNELNIL